MPVVAECEQLPVQQARRGDAAAWDAVFARYQLPLYAYVHQLVRDEQDSLDIVQETFVSAFRHLATLRDDRKFASWLFSIAHQKSIQKWRGRDKQAAVFDEVAAEPFEFEDGPDELLIRDEQKAAVLALLDQLPPPQRSVLLLHYLEDFPLDEIARITDAQLGTVKSRLHYAKRALKKLLEAP